MTAKAKYLVLALVIVFALWFSLLAPAAAASGVAPGTAGEEDGWVGSAAWAPDGETVAYVAYDAPEGEPRKPELWLVSVDGQAERLPLDEYLGSAASGEADAITDIWNLAWSPAGERLVFECRHSFRLAETIWSVRADGSDLRPIAEGDTIQVVPQ